MTAIYLILTLAVNQCPRQQQWNFGGNTVNTEIRLDHQPECACTAVSLMSWTRNKIGAMLALEAGARVIKIETMPLKISELHRDAKTTYSVSEEPAEVEP